VEVLIRWMHFREVITTVIDKICKDSCINKIHYAEIFLLNIPQQTEEENELLKHVKVIE
jgi:hypothetical protein